MERERRLRRQAELEARLAEGETKDKVDYAIKRAIMDTLQGAETRGQLLTLVKEEVAALREWLLAETGRARAELVQQVRDQQARPQGGLTSPASPCLGAGAAREA